MADGTCRAQDSSHEVLQVLQTAGSELVAFFHGEPVNFTIELDLQDTRPFTKAVLRQCSLIPRGAALTYGELALKAGYPGAARAVGQTMAGNLLPPFVPCHRVVGADGALTGFGGGIALKAKLLRMEGVPLVQKGSVLAVANLASGRTSRERRREQGPRRG